MSSLNAATLTTAQRNKMAMTYGLILGLIYIVIISLTNMAATALFLYTLLRGTGYLLYVVILGFMLARIRKANGGYIELREVFGPAFIILLIAGGLSYIWQYVYIYLVDPGFTDKVLNATVESLEKAKMSDEKIDEMVAEIEKSKTFNLGKTILGFFTSVLMDCLFGLVVSLIIKKQRPIFENLT